MSLSIVISVKKYAICLWQLLRYKPLCEKDKRERERALQKVSHLISVFVGTGGKSILSSF